MIRKTLLFAAALCCAATLFGRGPTTPHGWHDDFKMAQAMARRSNRPILLLLTGSDWCGFCIKLRREVLDTPEFHRYANNHLVLVFADAPRRVALPPHLAAQNRHLMGKYNPNGGVPCTVILDPNGVELGRISGCPRHPHDYLRQVRHFVSRWLPPPPPPAPPVVPVPPPPPRPLPPPPPRPVPPPRPHHH